MPAHNDITGASIQTRPASAAYSNGFDLIRNPQPAPGCVCSWRDRALGDGCQFCNHDLAAEIEIQNRIDADDGIGLRYSHEQTSKGFE